MTTPNTPKKPAPQDWHKADIVAAVHKKGSSLRNLAKARSLHPTAVYAALHTARPSYQQIIADFIGVAPQTIWPSRYHPDGTHKRGLRHAGERQSQSINPDGGRNGKAGGGK